MSRDRNQVALLYSFYLGNFRGKIRFLARLDTLFAAFTLGREPGPCAIDSRSTAYVSGPNAALGTVGTGKKQRKLPDATQPIRYAGLRTPGNRGAQCRAQQRKL